MMMILARNIILLIVLLRTDAFTVTTTASVAKRGAGAQQQQQQQFRMSSSSDNNDPNPPPIKFQTTSSATTMSPTTSSSSSSLENDPMSESLVDIETMKQLEKARRAQELRDQEVFMKKSLGKHKCNNCDWTYDVTKGDVMMIGGQIQPNTPFSELPSNWRCPVCRASKDSFIEMVEEIPGFEVNQKYGFGTNAWTAGQKNLAIFGGLGAFFLLFLSGYALS